MIFSIRYQDAPEEDKELIECYRFLFENHFFWRMCKVNGWTGDNRGMIASSTRRLIQKWELRGFNFEPRSDTIRTGVVG